MLVRDSARNALLVSEVLSDDSVSDIRDELLFAMLFAEPADVLGMVGRDQEAATDLVCSVLWDAFGIDATPCGEHADEYEDPVFDWDEDAARIRASLLECYGIDWDKAARSMSYADMCALLGSLLESGTETPFQQAVYYRTAKPPKATKGNSEQRAAFDARARHFALGGKAEQSRNDAMDSMFAAMRRSAKGA